MSARPLSKGLAAVASLIAVTAATSPLFAEERDPRMRPASTRAQPRVAVDKMTGVVRAEFINEVGANYRLVSVKCVLDGVQVCNKSGELGDRFWLFSRRVSTGNHRWTIVATYQGSGGVFSYASGYRFVVRNGGEITVDVDKALTARILAFESGGPTTRMADRLRMAIRLR